MLKHDELKQLAKKFKDKSRPRIHIVGRKALIPHKVKPSGEVVTKENLDIAVDLSCLDLNDLRFLDAWKDCGWNMEKACEKVGFTLALGKRCYEKVKYFEFEDKKIKTLAKVPTVDFVTAKNFEGFVQDNLSDGQRDHLKELAKITGAYKNTASLTITQNVFNLPKLTPEVEAEFKALAERTLDTEVIQDVA